MAEKASKDFDGEQSHIDDSGYCSSSNFDRSMSTALNQTDRALLSAGHQSERSSILTNAINQGGKFPFQQDNDLLPIDEDDADEKCSPIKPKVRNHALNNSSILDVSKEQSMSRPLHANGTGEISQGLDIFQQISKQSCESVGGDGPLNL